ncbi:MAG: hypothetical protein ACRCYY_10665 [Trueperaceae bacterium]
MFTAVLETFQYDPFFAYTLSGAVLLAFVSLVTGWLHRDFLAFAHPQVFFHLGLAVLAAMLLNLLSPMLSLPFLAHPAIEELNSFQGLSRLPLYIVTLAYGPTAGLITGSLFAGFSGASGMLDWSEAVLTLELCVLGWFALAPSPYKVRWAGPINVLLAYLLSWVTGGAALLQHLTNQGMDFSTHWNYHAPWLLGVGLSALLLFLFGPKMYQHLFTHSSLAVIVPNSSQSAKARLQTITSEKTPAQTMTHINLSSPTSSTRARPQLATTTLPTQRLERTRPRQHKALSDVPLQLKQELERKRS